MSSQNKEDIKTETDSEEPTGHSTSEVSERDQPMPVQEATEMTLANEPLKAKENFPFSTSKQDLDPTKTHLTHILKSTISQLSTDENLSSNIPPENKSVIEGEALEVQSEKEIPTEDESFDNQCQGLENQNGLPNCNLVSEAVRLPSIAAAENICSTSQQPSCDTTKHVEMKNPIQKQGNSISSPDSEVNNRKQENDPVDTTSQSKQNKSVIEGEALEVQSEKEIPSEDESFDNQCQDLDNQNRLPNCNLASEDARLLSTAAENICSTSQQPSCYTTKHVEMKNPIQKQGNSISSPDSEVNNPQQENDPIDTTSQSKQNKSVIEGEALEVQSEKEIPSEDVSFDNQCQDLDNQNRLPNCNLASEDARLLSTSAENICSTSQQPFFYTTKHVEMKNPIQKQGNSISPPDSEVNNQQQENDPVDTTSQSNFEDFALQLLTREDGKGPGPEQLSLGKLTPQNQISPPQSQKELPQRETMGSCESPSPSTTALLLEWHRGERIQIRQAAERMLKALFQEFKHNVESIETRDLGAEAAATSPSVSLLHFRLACSYLIQILANAIRSEVDSVEDISSDFLLCSEENPGREKNENVNQPPEINISDGQMNATNSQEELFASNMDPNPNPKNLLCISGAEEAARTPFTDDMEMDSRSNLNQGNYEVPFPNEGLSSWIFQANARPADNTAPYSFNTCVSQLVSPSHILPWNKYLQGREKRRAFLHSFNNLETNVMQNQWLLKTRGYNQHALGQNPPIASRVIGQSHRHLLRSNSN